jgi:hypothetical protein
MTTAIAPHSLLQEMAQIQQMERGKLCILRQGPDGPYYNHQTWENGKNVARYVPPDQLEAMQQAIAGYERFQALVKQYVELIVQNTRAQREAGLKKKTAAPNSSWRKRKKSNS